MYKILGADGKEYGPVSAERVRQWIAEGRANAQTKVQPEGAADWQTLGSLAEFADAFAPNAAAQSPPPFATAPTPLPIADDYELSLGDCLGRGWTLLQNNFGTLFVVTLIYFLIEGAIAGLGAIPLIGPVFSLANLVVAGPLLAGVYWVFLQANRNQPTNAGDVFAGFQRAFAQLFLGNLIPGLLSALCMIPALLVAAVTLLPSLMRHREPQPAALVLIGVVVLLCLIPVIFLHVNWSFTLPLIIDRRMDFWPAMQLSWRRVRKHWWHVFALLLVLGVVNIAGFLVCCVGLLFTLPLTIGALMQAYEILFSAGGTQTR